MTVSFTKQYGTGPNDRKMWSDYLSTADLSDGASTYLFLKFDGSNPGQVILATDGSASHGDRTCGVLYNAPTALSVAEVAPLDCQSWLLRVDSSGTAIAEGDKLKCNAVGKGIKASSSGDIYSAIAKRPSSGQSDDLIPVQLVPNQVI